MDEGENKGGDIGKIGYIELPEEKDRKVGRKGRMV